MQTFLPYPSFVQTAACLDDKRLGKQRVECLQICKAMEGGAWRNHPAVNMWRGSGYYLCVYWHTIVTEWLARGFNDSTLDDCLLFTEVFVSLQDTHYPDWLNDLSFHLSHQSNLLRKDPKHYSQFFPEVPNDLEYIWPGGKL